MPHILSNRAYAIDKTLLEQLWDRMELPNTDPNHIRASREQGSLRLTETTTGTCKHFATGEQMHATICSSMLLDLTSGHPVSSTKLVAQAAAPKRDPKAEAEHKQQVRGEVEDAIRHLSSNTAGRHAIDMLWALFSGPPLDERSKQAVQTLIRHNYEGHSGVVYLNMVMAHATNSHGQRR